MSNVIDINSTLKNKKIVNTIKEIANNEGYVEALKEILDAFVENKIEEIHKFIKCNALIYNKDKVVKFGAEFQYHTLDDNVLNFPDNIESIVDGISYTEALKLSPYSFGMTVFNLFDEDVLNADILILMLKINDLFFKIDKRSVVLSWKSASKSGKVIRGLSYVIESNNSTSVVCNISISLKEI